MRHMIAVSLVLAGILVFAADSYSEQQLVRVYCFAEGDDVTSFCADLAQKGETKKSLVIVDSKADADVVLEFLGEERIAARRFALLPYPSARKTTIGKGTAIARFGKSARVFSGTGKDDTAVGRAAINAEEWIRENRKELVQARIE